MTGRRGRRSNASTRCRTTATRTATDAPVDDPVLDAYVERIVRDAPPFTPRQRAQIAAILNGDAPPPRRACRKTSGCKGDMR